MSLSIQVPSVAADTQTRMSVWAWVAVGVASTLVLSAIVGLAIAAILGRISEDVSELLQADPWASAPLTRSEDSSEDESRAPHGNAVGRRQS